MNKLKVFLESVNKRSGDNTATDYIALCPAGLIFMALMLAVTVVGAFVISVIAVIAACVSVYGFCAWFVYTVLGAVNDALAPDDADTVK